MNKEKKWKIAPQIKKNLSKQKQNHKNNYHWAVAQILANRGISDKEEISCFLDPDYEQCMHDPFLFRDMQKAVDLIVRHIMAHNKIMIYGDYDADGVTASAVLAETISTLKGVADIYIPDRIKEGYGLNINAVDKIVNNNFKLIITVDGGIRSKQEVEYAKTKGIDVIITDHHTAPKNKKDLPDCLVINSVIPEEKYPFKRLAGVGVAFKLASAIITKTKLPKKDKKILEYRLLDLVAIGTVADRVPLLGENRTLVKKGLDIINQKTQRLGLEQLIKVACINKNNDKLISSDSIGFQLGPRINAAGRMANATTAFELLVEKNIEKAEKIANRLDKKNTQRKEETEKIIEKAEKQIVEMMQEKQDCKIIIAVGKKEDGWNEGIIGLVAGRISEKYYKPTLVITETNSGYKGSGRSIKEFNLMEAIEASSKFLEKYGGHPSACGLSLKKENLNKFKETIIKFAGKKLKNINLIPQINIEAELELDELNEGLVKEIEKLEPFGQDHERPIFVSKDAIIADILYMGINGNHIKIKLTNGRSGIISAIGFNQKEQWKDLRVGDRIDIAYYLEINKFNGRSDIQLKILDIKK